jgi:4-hydroxy-tetrahydrodipicolinate reductase
MENKIKVVQYGLGPIGIAAAKLVLEKKSLELVGGIDIDPEKVGLDLGDVLNLERNLGTLVSDDPAKLLNETKPDIVLHSTGSFLKKVEDQLEICIRSKTCVISSCEELFYPYYRDTEFSQRIDKLAKDFGVAVLGTGVNPGFSMDVLPLCMTSVCSDVKKITATRIVDASQRRRPLQKKIGAGLKPDEFRKLVKEGKLGHIGLVESLVAVANSLKWDLDDLRETIDPKISDRTIETPYLKVAPGEVAGILHVASGFKNGEELIKLELQMFVGAEEPLDSISIEGSPPIHLKIEGGIFGDTATIARMVNAIPPVIKTEPGLKTAVELPMQFFVN